jgi:hypothetical protein
MIRKVKTTKKIKNTENKEDNKVYFLILATFLILSIMITFVAFLSANSYHEEQIEINAIQESLLPKVKPIFPISLQYNLNIAPNFNGGMCTTMVNNTCIIRKVNFTQQNVFQINITYSGTYTMDIFVNPPAKVSLKMIIDYANNQTQNTLYFNDLSGLTVFSGPQVPSTVKLIFSNEGNTTATGYLKISEIPK